MAQPWPSVEWPPANDVVLANEFVELRPTALSDAPALFSALDHDSVWEHVAGRPMDVESMRELIIWKHDEHTWFPWTVTLLQDVNGLEAGTVVGTTSYLEIATREARLEIGSTTYAPAVWASKVNPSCKYLLLEYAFEVLGFSRVQLKTDVRNTRSQRAIDRLGATYEGLLRQYQRRADGSIRDTVLFSILDTEWPAVKARLQGRLHSE